MRTWPRSPPYSWLSSALLLAAGAVRADVEVRGKLLAERPPQGIVYLDDLPEQTAPEGARARMKQVDLAFVPQILAVLQGTAVDFVNADEMAHNVFSPAPEPFDLGTFGAGSRAHFFRRPGPHVILCQVHVEMVGWVLVLKNPAFARVERDGSFHLRAPPGRHHLVLWQPREPQTAREIQVPPSGTMEVDWEL